MSDSSDSENSPPRDPARAVDDHADAGSSRSLSSDSSSDNHPESSSNSDGVIVSRENIGGGDSDEVVVSEDAGREDMFMDAPEDLGADGRESVGFGEGRGSSDGEQHQERRFGHEMHNDYMVDEMERLRFMLDKAVNEKESSAQEFKDKMDRVAKAMAGLRDTLRGSAGDQHLQDRVSLGLVGSFDHYDASSAEASLHDIIHDCSLLVQSVVESNILKDQEIGDHNRHIDELSVSRDVVDVYLQSVRDVGLEAQFQKDQFVVEVADRILSSMASLVYVEGLQDDSVPGRIAHVEKCVYALIENYNWFLYQTDLLRQTMVEVRPDLAEQTDYGFVYASAKNELLEFTKKEAEFAEKLRYLENRNQELLDQLDKHKTAAETAHAELERTKVELDQERTRYSNTKEKLSLAVTKGKALVQQRDTLKQTLAEKTSELEGCLQEKSTALEAAEAIKEELVRSQISAASLQEMLSQKDLLFEKMEETLSECALPEGLSSTDVNERTRWLVDERNALKDVSLKFHKLADALLSIDLPENFSLSDLDSRMSWLKESFDQAKTEIASLQDEVAMSRDEASHQIDHLQASLSAALVEKDNLKSELDDMVIRFEQIVEKEHQASSEKEQVLTMIVEASGISEEGVSPYSSDSIVLVKECIGKIKQLTSLSLHSSHQKEVVLESILIHLYTRHLELDLGKELLEELILEKSESDNLLNVLKKASGEVDMLRVENENLKKDHEKAEEKSALLREKLSMAVKKGKGLFQDRENLKQLMEEKRTEIEKLTLELRLQESTILESRNEITKLSADVESIPKLEADLVAVNDQKHQLEKRIIETTAVLEMVMESIHNMCSVVLPSGSESEDPVEKVKWLEAHFSESQIEKINLAKELENQKAEVEALASKLAESHSTIKSVEEGLSAAESRISQLAEETRNLEVGKASVEEQLERVLEESRAKDSMFADANVANTSTLNALSVAETNIALLTKEKEDAQFGRTAAEAELLRVKEEVEVLTGKLKDASSSIMALEDTVLHLQIAVASLTEENIAAESDKNELEELKMLKEETNKLESKLQDAFVTIKSLEETLSKAESSASTLAVEVKAAEQEKLAISSKLNACMEESARTRDIWQTRSLELFSYIKDLELLLVDEAIYSLMKGSYGEKIESLKEIDLLFKSIRTQFSEPTFDNDPATGEGSYIEKCLVVAQFDAINTEHYASNVDPKDGGDIYLHAHKIVESFRLRHKSHEANFNNFSSFVNQCSAAVLEELRATRDSLKPVVQHVFSLKEEIKKLEADKLFLENAKSNLEDGISVLVSACTDATYELQLEAEKHERELGSYSVEEAESLEMNESFKISLTADKLLSVTRKAASVFEQFAASQKTLMSTVDELNSVLNDTKIAADKAMGERDLYQSKVSKLETDLEALQNLCSELETKLKDYQGIDVQLSSRDEEISSVRNALSMKDQEAREALIWVAQVKDLLDRVDAIEITSAEPKTGDSEPQDSGHIKKLIYIADNFGKLQHQVDSLSHDKAKLHTTMATQLNQVEHMKKLVEESSSSKQELARTRSEIFDIIAVIEGLVQKLGGAEIIGSENSAASKDLVEALQKQVMAKIVESEGLKSKVDVLDSQLRESRMSQDELFSKVKTLEAKHSALDDRRDQELAQVKNELLELVAGLRRIAFKLEGKDTGIGENQSLSTSYELIQVVEKLVMEKITESSNSKIKADELDRKLLASQKVVDDLPLKTKVLEDSLRSRAATTEIIQERSLFEAPSLPSTSEISEIEDVGLLAKPGIPPTPSAAHVRAMKKGSSDHIALDIESGRFISNDKADEDKGHVFKALNTSGLIPVQGKLFADRVDGVWVSGTRMLMSRPRARLGLIAYGLIIHLWLLGTIL
ncbi:Trans-Golgi network-localized SYP41-interacting protein 1-like protein [Drosera capensis]